MTAEAKAQERSGRPTLAAIFSGEPAFADRLPMLPVALERGAAAFAEALRGLLAQSFRLGLLEIRAGTAGDLLERAQGSGVTALLHAAGWESHLLVRLERELVFAYVDLVLGGDGSQPAFAAQRGLTRIETGIAASLIARLGRALESAFAPLAPSPFTPAGEPQRVDPDVLGGKRLPVAIARFRLEAGSAGGVLELAIPRTVLTALRPALTRRASVEPARADPGWSQQMQQEITRTKVSLKAVLDERLRPIAEVSALRVGQVIPLETTPRSRIRVECNGEPLLWCEIGRSHGAYTLRVHDFIDDHEEFMNGILYG